MFAGMAATGLPKGVSVFFNTWSGATPGALENKVTTSRQAPPWALRIAALMRNLARRGLLSEPQ